MGNTPVFVFVFVFVCASSIIHNLKHFCELAISSIPVCNDVTKTIVREEVYYNIIIGT